MKELQISTNFFEPKALDKKWILNTHSSNVLGSFQKLNIIQSEIRGLFSASKALVESRKLLLLEGLFQAAHLCDRNML